MQLLTDKQKIKIKQRAGLIKKTFKNPVTNILLFETLGSMILAYGICVTQYLHPISRKIPNPFWTFLISCFNFFAISIAGLFTGGQINPSATIGLYFAGKVSRKRLPVYIVSQLIGAFLGVTLYYAFFQQNPEIYGQTPEFSQIILDTISEIIGTFLFVFGILHLVVQGNYMKGQTWQYFYISLFLLVARTFTFRKGCLNPVIALAFQTFAAGTHQNFALFYSVFGVMIGQAIGAILAAFFYTKFYYPLTKQLQKTDNLKLLY